MTPEEWQIVRFTLAVAAAHAAIIPAGLVVAWLLARYRWPGKSLVETLVALPLVMPPVATGLPAARLLGRRGPSARLSTASISTSSSPGGPWCWRWR